jgi:hypothetical protein
VSISRPRKVSEIRSLFGNLAQTSQYQVIFGGLSLPLLSHLAIRGVDASFIGESAGLLCSSASLPGSSLATADISGNYTGVTEKFAHTRIFTQIDLTFLVDKEYKVLKFLEHWIEFIANGSGQNNSSPGYFYRMKYPTLYKCNSTKILKFNRDYKEEVEYNFFGMFPISLSSPTVSYDESQVLTASASFSYERYVSGTVNSLDLKLGSNNNKNISQPDDLLKQLQRDPLLPYRINLNLSPTNTSGTPLQ